MGYPRGGLKQYTKMIPFQNGKKLAEAILWRRRGQGVKECLVTDRTGRKLGEIPGGENEAPRWRSGRGKVGGPLQQK